MFYSVGGQSRDFLARLNTDGTLDTQFNPAAGGDVVSLAVQADGKILVSGLFGSLGGQSCFGFGRLNPEGTLDTQFIPEADSEVYSLAVRADGKVLAGGSFEELGGRLCSSLGRLYNSEPATQALTYNDSAITWQRGGASPEVWHTTFEISTDGTNWTLLGEGSRVSGGWQLGGVTIPVSTTIRARGYGGAGQNDGSGSLVEALLPVPRQSAPQILLRDRQFGFGTHGFGFDVSAAAGQVVAVDCSSNLVNWLPLQTNTLGSGPFYFSDPASKAERRQFYRARIVP
jgi:hypothetical protein